MKMKMSSLLTKLPAVLIFTSGKSTYHPINSQFEVKVIPTETSTGRASLQPRVIQCNVSDSSISQIHVNTWEYKDHADWMNEIHPGDLISVQAKGGVYGNNVVDFVRMDIYSAW